MADYSDNFNRANGSLGSNWTAMTGPTEALSISSNAVVAGSGTAAGAYWSANSFGNDQYAEMAVSAATLAKESAGPAVRIAAGAHTCYFARVTAIDDGKGGVGSYEIKLAKLVSGSLTALGSSASVPNTFNQWVLRLEVSGTSLTLKTATAHGGSFTTRVTATDSAIASGSAGFYLYGAYGSQQNVGDDWYGGDIGGGGGATVALTGSASSSTYGTLPAATLAPGLSGIANTLASGLMTLAMSVATIAAPLATTGQGSVGFGAPLTGSVSTATRGSTAPSNTVPLPGASATTGFGGVSPPLSLSGQNIATADGSVTPAASVALTGAPATSAAGSIPGIGLGLSGAQVTTSINSVGYGAPTIVGINGERVAVGYGRVNPATFAKTAAGALTPAESIQLSGLSLAANPGITASVVTGWVAQTATGSVSVAHDAPLASLQLAASSGAAAAEGRQDLTGRSVTAAQGAVSATGPGMVALTGSSLATTTGSAAPSDQHELTGSSAATGSAGLAAAVNSVPLAGGTATTSVGTVGVISTGSVQLVGLGLTCARGTVYTSGNPSDEASAASWTESARHLVWKRLPTTTDWRP